MAAEYTSVCDVADFLNVTISCATTPSTAQVTTYIERNQEVIDRRTGMTWIAGGKTETNEWQDLHLIYTFGWGTFATLKRRALYTHADGLHLDSGQGDKLEIWSGATGAFTDQTDNFGTYNVIAERGEIYMRGFLFSILRKNRMRITYRYGETSVPDDIEKACLLMTCIDIVRKSFRMDEIAFGGSAINKERSMADWEDEIERIIRNREEVFFIP